MSNKDEKRSRWAPWLDRLKIIVLGLTLGLGARFIVRNWPGSDSSAKDSTKPAFPAPEVPSSSTGS
jgi:hypothetical protein